MGLPGPDAKTRARMIAMRRAGDSYKDIGIRFGKGRTWAQRILTQVMGDEADVHLTWTPKLDAELERLAKQVPTLALWQIGEAMGKEMKAVGVRIRKLGIKRSGRVRPGRGERSRYAGVPRLAKEEPAIVLCGEEDEADLMGRITFVDSRAARSADAHGRIAAPMTIVPTASSAQTAVMSA